MRLVFQIISWLSLAATVLFPVLYLMNKITIEQSNAGLLVATIVWFVHTPLWMGRKPEDKAGPSDGQGSAAGSTS